MASDRIDILIKFGALLKQFVTAAEGNISMRTDVGFIIKASGARMGSLTESDFVECDLDGNSIGNSLRPPSIEATMHSWIYKNSDVKFIAHTHPTNTVSILCTDYIISFADNRLFPDHVVFNGEESCVVPYSHPGKELTDTLSKSIGNFNKFPSLILLQNHGIICAGKTEIDCVSSTEICEKAATIYINAMRLTKSVNFLDVESVTKLTTDKKEIYRKSL